MNWIRGTLVDIAVTVCIVIAVFLENEAARWVIMIYTPFILLLKIGALLAPNPRMVKKSAAKKDEAPAWIYHLLYAANVVLLVVPRWWWLATGWAAIWIVSYVATRKQ